MNICEEWRKNKNINPRTNRIIKKDGSVFKSLEKECDEENLNFDICEEWRKNKNINPRTNRIIKKDGSVFKSLEKECDEETEYPEYTPLNKRIQNSKNISKIFKKIFEENDNFCISGKNSYFKSKKDIKIVGTGTFGVVYKAKLKDENTDFIAKEAFIDYDEIPYTNKYNKNFFSFENLFLDAIRIRILEKKLSPHFIFFYGTSYCDSCTLKRILDTGKKKGECYVSLLEIQDFDLKNISFFTEESQKSLLFQLLLAIHVLHSELSIFHSDIKVENILIKLIKPEGFLKYVIGKNIFYVKNTGFIIFISDFGVSKCFNPKKINNHLIYSQEMFEGTILAEVVYENEIPYFFPLENTNVNWLDEKGKIFLKESKNKITYDSNKFPPLEFFWDLQDILRIFVGGKHSVQTLIHDPLDNLSDNLKCQINSLVIDKFIYSITSVKYVLAIEMLKQFYTNIDMNEIDFILDEFYI
jgi:hypothetical protein